MSSEKFISTRSTPIVSSKITKMTCALFFLWWVLKFVHEIAGKENAQVTPFYTTNTLGEYICKPQNCFVTWAFAVTNAIDRLNNRFHFSSYDPIVEVALSAQELIDCVGKEHGVTGKVCDGLPLVWVPNPSTRTVSPTVSSTTTPTRRRSA